MYCEHSSNPVVNAKMKRNKWLLIVICAMFYSSAWGQVIAISDNFDDNEIDTSIWRSPGPGDILGDYPRRYPVEQNQRLEIVNDGTEDDSIGLRTQMNLPADGYFQVQVSFNASDCDEQSALFLSVHNATTDDESAVQYAMIGNGVVEGRRWFVIHSAGDGDEEPIWAIVEETEIEAGTLYMTYEAGIIHLSYTSYGQENALYTTNISEWTDCEQVWIALTAWSNDTTLSGSGSYFDDFSLTTSEVPGDDGEIEEVIDFFDESVADGTLVGDGPGKSADGRRGALRNMIIAAGDLIEEGLYEEACDQLWAAYRKCDGDPKPPDFVAGDAADDLAVMILGVMYEIGCE